VKDQHAGVDDFSKRCMLLLAERSARLEVDVEVSIAKRTRMLKELSYQKKDETWLQFVCLCVTSVFIILLCLV